VKNVVNIKGSLPAGDVFSAGGNPAVATLTGMLLDQGTTTQDKFAIAAKLDAVGATLEFSVDNEMVEITAKCLKKDVPLVIALIAEQLRSPALSAEEFEKARSSSPATSSARWRAPIPRPVRPPPSRFIPPGIPTARRRTPSCSPPSTRRPSTR